MESKKKSLFNLIRDTIAGMCIGFAGGVFIANYYPNTPETPKSCSDQTIEIPYAVPNEKHELILQDLDNNHRFEVYRKSWKDKEFVLVLDENCEPLFTEYKPQTESTEILLK